MKRPTKEEHADHLRNGMKGKPCLVCDYGENNLVGRYTDFHGEIKCIRCGMCYQVSCCQLTDDYLLRLGLTKDDVKVPYCSRFESVPICKCYWVETGATLPFGTWLSDSPVTTEQHESFWRWLSNNHERFESEWHDDFNWQKLKEMFPPNEVLCTVSN